MKRIKIVLAWAGVSDWRRVAGTKHDFFLKIVNEEKNMPVKKQQIFLTILSLAALLVFLQLFLVSAQMESEGDKATKKFLDNVVKLNVNFSNGRSENGFPILPTFSVRIRSVLPGTSGAPLPAKVKAIETKAGNEYKNDKGFLERDYGNGIIMVNIPKGKFEMGSKDGVSDERPPHEVYLDGYWIGKYEVTVKQYMQFVNDTKTHYPIWLEEGNECNINTGSKDYYKKCVSDENCPIVGISWDDAKAYCDWLSEKTGLNFKLPTEARWEKAARGNAGRKYPWGGREPDETLANFGGKIGKTTPVGSYPNGASPYGLLDMAGNVWEWCYDWYGRYNAEFQKNPTGSKNGSYRVKRGGGWNYDAGFLRCAGRSDRVRPSSRYSWVGFRLAQDN